MKNILKGWFFSIIGAILMIGATLYYFEVLPFDIADGVNMTKEKKLGIAFIVGLVMFCMPPTWFEKKIGEVTDKVVKKKLE
jgi:hypothetical protein